MPAGLNATEGKARPHQGALRSLYRRARPSDPRQQQPFIEHRLHELRFMRPTSRRHASSPGASWPAADANQGAQQGR